MANEIDDQDERGSTLKYVVVRDFSRYPGGRLKKHGPFSGEEFRVDVLEPALAEFDSIQIDLTGAAGYPASFLDESFGELGHIYGIDELRRRLTFTCEDDPFLIPIIWEKIELASQETK